MLLEADFEKGRGQKMKDTGLRVLKSNYGIIMKLIGCFAVGAAMAFGSVFGVRGVHIICLAAVLPFGFGLASVVGALTVLFTVGINTQSVSVICCAVCLLLVSRLFDGISRKRYPLAAAIVTVVVMISGGVLAAAVGRQDLRAYISVMLLSAFSGAAIYIMTDTFNTSSMSDIKRAGLKGTTVAAAFLVSWSACVHFKYFNLGSCVFMLFTCVLMHRLKKASAVISISAVGAALIISGENLFAEAAVMLMLTAICPDIIKRKRIFVCTYIFAAATALSFALQMNAARILFESLFAAAAFMLLPSKAILNGIEDDASPSSELRALKQRLGFISSGISSAFDSDTLTDTDDDTGVLADTKESVRISDAVYAGVCMGCGRYQSCYSESSEAASTALSELDNPLLGDINASMDFCIRRREVKRCAYEAARRQRYMFDLKKYVDARRGSFVFMTDALRDIALDVCDSRQTDEILTSKLEGAFNRDGIEALSCLADTDGCVELYFSQNARINESKIKKICSAVLGRTITDVFSSSNSGIQRFLLTPEPKYHFEAGVCQIAKKIGRCIGDYAGLWNCGKYSYAVISDGMGTGREAKLSSERLVKAVEKLINAGLSVNAALKTASEYMRCCFEDESFATLDMLRANVFTGEINIYKCGADKSYVIGDTAQYMLPAGGYPLGIIEDMSVSEHSIKDYSGTVIVMMTDGANRISGETIAEFIESDPEMSCEDLCAQLTKAAKLSQASESDDDITVSVVRIRKNG